MRVVVFTTLFPNAVQPTHGNFVLERLRHLVDRHGVDVVVVAPVPYFPTIPGFGRWSRSGAVPARETIHGLEVYHPRYLVTPKVGMSLYPITLALGAWRRLSALKKEGFEILDAHYVYPDGVAAALLARYLSVPLVVTGRGSDVQVLPRYGLPRRWIRWALGRADALVGVSSHLAEAMGELAGGRAEATMLRNGVDLHRFRPADRGASRRALGLSEDGRLIASVGQLIERKGHDVAIEALAKLHRSGVRDVSLVIVGEGLWEGRLRRLARSEGVEKGVVFLGSLAHPEIARVFAAADLMLLASRSEGWANVLLEALACGTPVVATALPGTREVLGSAEVGILVEGFTADGVAAALGAALARRWDAQAIRAYAEGFSWDATSDGQMALFREALRRFEAAAKAGTGR